MTEEWRPIAGYEGWYSISSHGRVRRDKSVTCAKAGAILSTAGLRGGYPTVSLSKNGRVANAAVHNLVADAFLSPRPAGKRPNHKDTIKTNNRADNLEWMTQAENVQHAYDAGLRDCRGSGNGQAKLTEEAVREIRKLATGARGEQRMLAERFGTSRSNISTIVSRKAWEHVT